jgi:ABC-2 type transport system ATP-binding protein
MDEPTSGLAPLKQEEFNTFIRNERDRGKTIFFSSHVLSEVRRVCDRVGILRDGQVVALEPIESLLNRGGKRVHIQTTDATKAEIVALDGVVDVTAFSEGLQFIYTGEYNTLLRELTAFDVLEIEIAEPPVEDVFLHYYGTGGTAEASQEVRADV